MKLNKALKTYDVFSIGAGAMISSGLFILPSVAYAEVGPWSILSYFFAGILMLPALFSQLELATALPKAGGTYFFIERILGSSSGMAAGFANWFSIALKSALALVGIGYFASLLFPELTPFQLKLISAGACVIFTCINIFSTESSGHAQGILVIVLLAILGQFVLAGYRSADFSFFLTAEAPDWQNIISVTGMVFISYGGLTKVASVAEEVKDPGRSLVKGCLLAFLIVQSLYVLTVLILCGVLSPNEFTASYTPVSDAAAKMFSQPVIKTIQVVLLSSAAIIAFITTANAGILSASRVPMAMSRDNMLPAFFQRVSKKRKTPVLSILFTSGFMLLIIFTLDLTDLAKTASLFMLLLFLMVNLSVIVIRSTKMSNYRPVFKSPFYPVIQVIGIVCYASLIFNMGLKPFLTASVFLAVSILWFLLFVKKHVNRKSALLHMVEKLAAKQMPGEKLENLEKELLEILLERDEVKDDRFSSLVRSAVVMDLDREVSRDELFSLIAEKTFERWGIEGESLKRKLHLREDDAATLVYPGVAVPHAIPHVVVDGEKIFDIVLVRNKKGIIWNDDVKGVHTVFCLIGSQDERDFHLKALMSIAQILQSPGFIQDWQNAESEEELKTVMLLAKRRFLEN